MRTSLPPSPLKIGLLGYGRMGQAIEALALRRGDEILWKADRQTASALDDQTIQAAEVIIEFTQPDAAPAGIRRCLTLGVPVVSGTTGWQSLLPDMQALAHQLGVGFLHASNFSIGVQLFFEIARQASHLMHRHTQYKPSILEVHHVHKKDAPSGTAITLAEQVMDTSDRKWQQWLLQPADTHPNGIPIEARREADVPGTHTLIWESAIDQIQLTHQAHNREGFAHGALEAAHWIIGKKGAFTMRHVLGMDSLNDNLPGEHPH